jgi:hypothetical protein
MRPRTVAVVCVLGLALVGFLVAVSSPGPGFGSTATDDAGAGTAAPPASTSATSTPVGATPATTTSAVPTAAASPPSSATPDVGTARATDRPAPFAFEIVGIQECGRTCRDVTVDLTNNRETRATEVTVSTRLFAGTDTTSDALVWTGRAAVGAMDAGETVTRAQRIELGFWGAAAVQARGGWITVETTVTSADTSVTFERAERVG